MPAPRPTGSRHRDSNPSRGRAHLGWDAIRGEPVWLEMSVSTEPGHALVALGGELDIAGTGTLGFQMSALAGQGCTRIVGDVADIVFCDASGPGTSTEGAHATA